MAMLEVNHSVCSKARAI